MPVNPVPIASSRGANPVSDGLEQWPLHSPSLYLRFRGQQHLHPQVACQPVLCDLGGFVPAFHFADPDGQGQVAQNPGRRVSHQHHLGGLVTRSSNLKPLVLTDEEDQNES